MLEKLELFCSPAALIRTRDYTQDDLDAQLLTFSRHDLVRRTKKSKATVNRLIKQWSDRGYVKQSGAGRSTSIPSSQVIFAKSKQISGDLCMIKFYHLARSIGMVLILAFGSALGLANSNERALVKVFPCQPTIRKPQMVGTGILLNLQNQIYVMTLAHVHIPWSRWVYS